MEPAQFLTPDTSSQLKKSSEIFTAYLKAKQEAALANASKNAIDENGNFDAKRYRSAALMGGVPVSDINSKEVQDAYDFQQRMEKERARTAHMLTERTQVGNDPATHAPIYANPGEVDTRSLAVDPRLAAVNATPQAMDEEAMRSLAANQRAALAAQSAQMATASGAPPNAGVGTPEDGATSTERAIYGGGRMAQQPQEIQHGMPLMDVKGIDADTAKDLAYGLRTQGLYKDRNDIPGPNMQGALNKWYGDKETALLKKQPLSYQFPNWGEYTKAKNAWEAEVAGLPVAAREELAGWRDKRQANIASRVGVKGALQTQKIQGKEFADAQEIVNAAHADKYFGVSKENAPKFIEAKAAQDWLQKSVDDMGSLSQRIQSGETIPPKEFGGVLMGLQQSSMAADGINDIGAREKFEGLIPQKQETKQALREAKTVGQAIELIAKNAYTTDDQIKILKTLSAITNQQLHSGKNAAYLETMRTRKKKKGLEGAIKDKITSAIKNAADIPAEQRKVGMKAKLGNSGKIGTWNGKVWDVQ